MTKTGNSIIDLKYSKKKSADFEEALECTGFGKYNIVLTVACGFTLLSSNIENYSIGYVLPSAQVDLSLNNSRKGILTSSTFFGILISSVFWGYISDRNGRRKLMYISLFASFITSALATVMPDYWSFVILRFITGICISGPSAIIFAYFSEFQCISYRSKAIAFISLFIASALLLLPGLGWAILKSKIDFEFLGWFTYREWRLFMFINAIPNLIAAIVLLFFPESPKYLYHSGRLDEALEVLRKMYVINTGSEAATFPIESLDEKILIERELEVKKSILTEMYENVVNVFKPPSLKYSVAGCVLQAGVFAISSGLLLWYPDIINQLEKHSGESSLTVCKALSMPKDSKEESTLEDSIFIQNLIIGGAYLLGYSFWGVIVKTLGNKWVFIGSMVLSTIGAILLCFIGQKTVINIMFVLVLVLPGICVAVINALVVDLIPTHLCGMAVCITMTAGRLGSIASSSVVGILLDWNCIATFLIYAAILVCCLLVSLIFPRKS